MKKAPSKHEGAESQNLFNLLGRHLRLRLAAPAVFGNNCPYPSGSGPTARSLFVISLRMQGDDSNKAVLMRAFLILSRIYLSVNH
jgi:hypothetical protein